MIIIDIDGFADAITNGTSGMLNAASEVAQAVCSVPWLLIPSVVAVVVVRGSEPPFNHSLFILYIY